ncbi:hypothetical protein BVRB_5g114520 [Beta vulgaris subsp. vulgaris]|nr:hypothetical protein BVRB_5g114520 [Beta vulgaris subsp. vulgaris]
MANVQCCLVPAVLVDCFCSFDFFDVLLVVYLTIKG